MGRVDDQHGMELETDRARLDAAHAGQEHGAEQLFVTGTRVNFGGDLFEQFVALRVLNETDERFDLGAEGNELACGLVFGGRSRQSVEETEVAQCGDGARSQRAGYKASAIDRLEHDGAPSSERSGTACCSARAFCLRPR